MGRLQLGMDQNARQPGLVVVRIHDSFRSSNGVTLPDIHRLIEKSCN
jgi:hypothetical protein